MSSFKFVHPLIGSPVLQNTARRAKSPLSSSVSESSSCHERFGLPSFEDSIFLIFGYGSILWKQNFEFVAEYDTYIKGFQRVFYQGTTDHRGVPGQPGRVVTILPHADANHRVYGKAYQLPSDPAKVHDILAALDVREQCGYDRIFVDLFDAHPAHRAVETPLGIFTHANFPHQSSAVALAAETGKNVICLCYIATEDNEDYLGAASMEEMAREILRSSGMSGTNREYLFKLADCLREMSAPDDHVLTLDQTARRILYAQAGAAAATAALQNEKVTA